MKTIKVKKDYSWIGSLGLLIGVLGVIVGLTMIVLTQLGSMGDDCYYGICNAKSFYGTISLYSWLGLLLSTLILGLFIMIALKLTDKVRC